jgi:hypothetical protein
MTTTPLGWILSLPRVHGPGGDEDLGNEDLVVLEQHAQALHARDQPLVEDLSGRQSVAQRLVHQGLDVGFLSRDQGFLHLFEHRISP